MGYLKCRCNPNGCKGGCIHSPFGPCCSNSNLCWLVISVTYFCIKDDIFHLYLHRNKNNFLTSFVLVITTSFDNKCYLAVRTCIQLFGPYINLRILQVVSCANRENLVNIMMPFFQQKRVILFSIYLHIIVRLKFIY